MPSDDADDGVGHVEHHHKHNKTCDLREEPEWYTVFAVSLVLSAGANGGVGCDLASGESRRFLGNMERRRFMDPAMPASSMSIRKLVSSMRSRRSAHSTTQPILTTDGLGSSNSLHDRKEGYERPPARQRKGRSTHRYRVNVLMSPFL